jgi:hypothetical protein
MSLRTSVTSELAFDQVRLPSTARLPEAEGLGAPLSCLGEARFGIIFGAVVLAPGYGAYGLAYGVIVGAAAHATIQFVDLALRGWSFRPSFDRHTEGLGTVARLMAPRIVGQAAFQVNIIVMTNFASRLGESRVSALNYAYQLFMLPHGVLALSLSTVIFPLMARQFELGELHNMKQTLARALGPLLFLTFPAAIGLIAFRESIVQMILEFVTFTEESTQLADQRHLRLQQRSEQPPARQAHRFEVGKAGALALGHRGHRRPDAEDCGYSSEGQDEHAHASLLWPWAANRAAGAPSTISWSRLKVSDRNSRATTRPSTK